MITEEDKKTIEGYRGRHEGYVADALNQIASRYEGLPTENNCWCKQASINSYIERFWVAYDNIINNK